MPQVEVTFDIDANGILHVSAKDRTTGKEQKIRIEASSGLSETEIQKMVKTAEEHASDDKKRREEIEHRNRLDGLVYQVEKESKEWIDKVDASQRDRLNAAVDGAKKALRSGAAEEIRTALEELTQAYSAAGASLYQAAGRTTGEPAGGTEGAGAAGPEAGKKDKEDVVEADYEIVDEDKK
jgi:molecular chaperone DnaK